MKSRTEAEPVVAFSYREEESDREDFSKGVENPSYSSCTERPNNEYQELLGAKGGECGAEETDEAEERPHDGTEHA